MKKSLLWINIIGMILLSSMQFSCKKDKAMDIVDYKDLDQYYIVGILDLDKYNQSLYSFYFGKEDNTLYAHYSTAFQSKKVVVQQNNDTLQIDLDPYREQSFTYSVKKEAGKYVLKFISANSGVYGYLDRGDSYLFRKSSNLSYQGNTYENLDLVTPSLYYYLRMENLKWGMSPTKNIVLNKTYTPIADYIWQGENFFGVLVPEWKDVKSPLMLVMEPMRNLYKFKKID